MKINFIEKYNLEKHPEGGYFRRTYVSENEFGSSIYYYLESDDFSAWHCLTGNDEMWHYYSGSSLTLHLISPQGELTHQILGDPLKNESTKPQVLVPAGYWVACEVDNQNVYSFVGCTVWPEFTFEKYKLAKAAELLELFPQHSCIIKRLTRQ